MYQILTLNKISATGLDRLPAEQYTHGNEIAQPDAIMVRSASMHEMKLDEKTVAIARAAQALTIFRWMPAASRALWFLTPPVRMPTL